MKRNTNGTFAKGNEGGGRKAIPVEIHRLFTDKTEDAVNTIIGIMSDENQPANLRLRAAMFIVQQGWGRALQMLQGNEADKVINPIAHSFDSLI